VTVLIEASASVAIGRIRQASRKAGFTLRPKSAMRNSRVEAGHLEAPIEKMRILLRQPETLTCSTSTSSNSSGAPV